jgi:pyruvate formate lyase activating enzyme
MPTTARATLAVGGFVPFTTVDYPGKLSAVVFCQGCPWRCGYCHNAHLQTFTAGVFPWADIHAQLVERQGFLEAVVFSGGEPTAQASLPGAMAEMKALGFLVGLHTAGIYPGRLAAVLPLADWVGFDMKAPFDGKYDALTQRDGAWLPARESLRLLLASKVDYQIRTTLDRTHLDDSACSEVQRQLHALGAKPTLWQACRPPVTALQKSCEKQHQNQNF